MSVTAVAPLDVQDGVVIPHTERSPDCPDPCGCEEANALRDLLETIVQFDEETNPCDPDWCKGQCAFCKAKVLLDGLKEKRRLPR